MTTSTHTAKRSFGSNRPTINRINIGDRMEVISNEHSDLKGLHGIVMSIDSICDHADGNIELFIPNIPAHSLAKRFERIRRDIRSMHDQISIASPEYLMSPRTLLFYRSELAGLSRTGMVPKLSLPHYFANTPLAGTMLPLRDSDGETCQMSECRSLHQQHACTFTAIKTLDERKMLIFFTCVACHEHLHGMRTQNAPEWIRIT